MLQYEHKTYQWRTWRDFGVTGQLIFATVPLSPSSTLQGYRPRRRVIGHDTLTSHRLLQRVHIEISLRSRACHDCRGLRLESGRSCVPGLPSGNAARFMSHRKRCQPESGHLIERGQETGAPTTSTGGSAATSNGEARPNFVPRQAPSSCATPTEALTGSESVDRPSSSNTVFADTPRRYDCETARCAVTIERPSAADDAGQGVLRNDPLRVA